MKPHQRKLQKAKAKSQPVAETVPGHLPSTPASMPDSQVPPRDAFLEEAKKERKRKLITDHIQTINTLRNEKRFTFRAIADWLTKRGIEADHSSVYRAYLGAIPEDQRDPRENWSDVDQPE